MGYSSTGINPASLRKAILDSGLPVANIEIFHYNSTSAYSIWEQTIDVSDVDSLFIGCKIGVKTKQAGEEAHLFVKIDTTTLEEFTTEESGGSIQRGIYDISSYSGEHTLKLQLMTDNSSNYAFVSELRMWAKE